MVNITGELLTKPEFEHVKQLRVKLRQINNKGATFDNGEPATLKLGKQILTANKSAFEIAEHKREVASLQRRIAHAGDVSKNYNEKLLLFNELCLMSVADGAIEK